MKQEGYYLSRTGSSVPSHSASHPVVRPPQSLPSLAALLLQRTYAAAKKQKQTH